MAWLVITGASGYIGSRLVSQARAQGHSVTLLGRAPAGDDLPFLRWTFGEDVPPGALAGADAVIHLAHAWRADGEGGVDLNASASETLARAATTAGVPRFVFASSTSSRPDARNAYGRIKHDIEQRLASMSGSAGRIVSARIALVYGGPASGQYGLMRRITRLLPILPMIGLDREVQPIHLDEVCAALLALALKPGLQQNVYVVASPAPMRFARWLRILRRIQTGRGLLLIPIPTPLMLLACDFTAFVPFLPTVSRERVLGLAGTAPMASREDMMTLGLAPGDPHTLLLREEGKTSEGEAQALLRYLHRSVPPVMTRDLAGGLARAGLAPLGLPRLLINHPRLIALVEPPATHHANRLARALYLASQVIEAHDPPPRRESLPGTALLVLCDLLTWPLRLVTARRYQ